MTTTSEEIRSAMEALLSHEKTVANQCGRITSMLEFELEDRDCTYTRQIGAIQSNGNRSPHVFVTVPGKEFTDLPTSQDVIIDATIRQFNDENKKNIDEVKVSLEGDYPLPVVGIYTPSDPEYALYQF